MAKLQAKLNAEQLFTAQLVADLHQAGKSNSALIEIETEWEGFAIRSLGADNIKDASLAVSSLKNKIQVAA